MKEKLKIIALLVVWYFVSVGIFWKALSNYSNGNLIESSIFFTTALFFMAQWGYVVFMEKENQVRRQTEREYIEYLRRIHKEEDKSYRRWAKQMDEKTE